jgi:hypothetical protein
MRTRAAIAAALGVAVIALATACTTTTTTQGKPTAPESATRSATTTISPEAPATTATSPSASATPSGPPVGTATMQVSGGAGPVTIRYQINGGPEQSETGVTLPWEKRYPVYNEIQSSVTADGGDTELICSILMDGKLLAFKHEAQPTCSFAYWG